MLVELVAACLLLMYEKEIGEELEKDLKGGLAKAKQHTGNLTTQSDWDIVQNELHCCGIFNYTDWGDKVPTSCCEERCEVAKEPFKHVGCLVKLNNWFEKNFLTTGIGVIIVCIIEVLGMCFAMTLFCHISRSGLGYKL